MQSVCHATADQIRESETEMAGAN
eukprot:SAG31_NODE_16819_length_694_cov_1.300840_1_plen_23_part_10